MNQRQFKGVWIPARILEDNTLTAVDKILLADVDSFTGRGSAFFKSNARIAEDLGCSIATVKRVIAKLVQRNLIELVGNDGRTRHMRTTLSYDPAQYEPSGGSKTHRQEAQNAPIVIQGSKPPRETSKSLDFGALDSPDFRLAWEDWKTYKRDEHRFKFKSATTEQVALNKLIRDSNGNEHTAITAITESIANGWKGIFIRHQSSHRDQPTDAGRASEWADQ